MKTSDYLRLLKEEIHSAVFSTVDEQGLPHSRVIDVMLADDNSLYFITAKGKQFYEELTKQKFVAVSGMTSALQGDSKNASLQRKSVSVRGYIKEMGAEWIDRVFEENPYMAKIYPDPKSREILVVFRLTDGEGEFFDLSTQPITRAAFTLGHGLGKQTQGYFINEKCKGCKICYSKCPQKCIDLSQVPLVIDQSHCLHCGICMRCCPFKAVEKRTIGWSEKNDI